MGEALKGGKSEEILYKPRMMVVIDFSMILAAFLAIYIAVGLGFLLYGILFQFDDLRAIADQHGDIWFLIFVGTLIWAWPLLIILMATEGMRDG